MFLHAENHGYDKSWFSYNFLQTKCLNFLYKVANTFELGNFTPERNAMD